MRKEFENHLEQIEKSIRELLPLESDDQWLKKSFNSEEGKINNSHVKSLLEPVRNLVDLGGKRWRPLFLVLCAGDDKKLAYEIAPVVEYVHTASLIHDDIEDSSDMRRGKPAAYITYGTDVAINAASWLYFQAAAVIENAGCSDEMKLRLYRIYTEELRRLHLGQSMDITWHRDPSYFPTVDEYVQMVRCKTGTLASLSAKLGVLCAGKDEESVSKAGKIAAKIGEGFQIIDDVINLTAGNPGKKRGDDIVEGKKSLPVLYFAGNADNSAKEELASLFEKAGSEGIDSPAVEKAISLLEKSGAIQKALERGKNCISEGCREFSSLLDAEDAEKVRELFTSMIPRNL